jgi:glycosyltransferase involved in cell wall biosynthesis
MKIIQVPFCSLPDAIGGTEVYVATLAKDLQKLGFETVIAAPGEHAAEYKIDGLRVRRFPTTVAVEDIADLYGSGDATAAAAFATILDDEKPDLVHLHAFTRAVSTKLIEACGARDIATVFTYHTPTVSCQRGTLMHMGRVSCDGKLDVVRCTSCTLHGLGVPEIFANLLGYLPQKAGARLGAAGQRGKAWTALRMSHLMALRHAAFFDMMRRVDHIVAVCDWARDVLITNGISRKTISVVRHGIVVPSSYDQTAVTERRDHIHIAFMGRFDQCKGLHILVDALMQLPRLPIRLDVFAVSQSDANRRYANRILKRAKGDPRITVREPLNSGEVIKALRAYDYLAVPSQWMETGPLVVLEAFAAGIPVIGSGIGGLSELVRDGVDGLLVVPSSSAGWKKVLVRIATNPDLRKRLKRAVRAPKDSTEVAAAMAALYEAMLAARRTPRAGAGPPDLMPSAGCF